ncbi:MAG: glycosyltransferase [Cytophagales bacterium]
MKILHVVESFGGGSAVFISLLSKYLSNHEHIVLYGLRKDEQPFEVTKSKFPQSVKFVYWKSATRELSLINDFLAFIELNKKIKNLNPDVVHLHSSKAGFIGRFSCYLLGRKCIYSTHSSSFLRQDISSFKRKFFVLLEKLASIIPCEVIACSRSEMNAFLSYSIKATYINNGTEIQESEDSLKQITSNKLKICTVGRITNQKNPELFNEIANSYKQADFIWVGDGLLRSSLKSDNIQIIGWVSKEEVLQIVKDCDIYLSTSLWEGLPLSVLEAMALSKPLVLNKCVGNVDLVKDNRNGLVFESKTEAINYLNKLDNDRSLIYKIGMESFLICKSEFNIKDNTNAYERKYQELLSKN